MTPGGYELSAEAREEVQDHIAEIRRCLADVLFTFNDASSALPANDRLANFHFGASRLAEALQAIGEIEEIAGCLREQHPSAAEKAVEGEP